MTNNTNTNNNFEIPLQISDKLKKECIIQKFVKNPKYKYVKIELNHKYEKSTVVITTDNRKDWIKFLELVKKALEFKGIHNQEHIRLIIDVFDDNYNLVYGINDNDEDYEYNGIRKIEEKEEKKSLSQILVELVLQNCVKLFKDEFNEPHIIVTINDHYKTLPINSTKFKRYLSKLYYDTYEGRIANTESINSAVSQLEAKAFYEGPAIALHLRVAWGNPDTTDSIYYDLSDEKNRCVKITKDGCTILENQTDVLFRRYDNLIPQVKPIRSITISFDSMDSMDSKMFDEFISLFNIKNKENAKDIKLLLKCNIICLFIPDIPKPILLLHGEQGGAKSTFQELIKMLIDPSITKTLTFPRDSNEFIQQLSHNYIAYYDNVSVIQDWISDLLCRAVTGSSFSKRALYTNDDDIYYNFKRIIGINGIDLAATKADLLDRSIITQTERINKKDRKKIKKIWEKFNQLKPYVLGYIFDILAKVLRYKEEHGEIDFPDGLNRMADWEEYAEIISRCLGNPDGEFQRVYQENIGVQIDEAIESSLLSQAIIELMNNSEIEENELTKTPTELYTELEKIAVNKLHIDPLKIKSWPKSASHLTRRINGMKTILREKGIEITLGKDQGRRTITICKVLSLLSMQSSSPESSTKEDEKMDSKSNNEQMPSQVPSIENGEKQEQNPNLDSKDSKDGNLQTCKEEKGKNNDYEKQTIEESTEEKWRREQEEIAKWKI